MMQARENYAEILAILLAFLEKIFCIIEKYSLRKECFSIIFLSFIVVGT